MSKKKFNGEINGKPVKMIVSEKEGFKKQWFAKPKNDDVDTPHFVEYHGTLQVHEDSANGESFRAMDVNLVYSGSFETGSTFASNHGMDMVILPMSEEANGFAINTSYSGSAISVTSNKVWCLIGIGTFGAWLPKP